MSDNEVPIAPKVKWSAAFGALAGAVIPAVIAIMNNGAIVQGLPAWVPILVGLVLGGGATGIAGYAAPHQPRPGDLARPEPFSDEF